MTKNFNSFLHFPGVLLFIHQSLLESFQVPGEINGLHTPTPVDGFKEVLLGILKVLTLLYRCADLIEYIPVEGRPGFILLYPLSEPGFHGLFFLKHIQVFQSLTLSDGILPVICRRGHFGCILKPDLLICEHIGQLDILFDPPDPDSVRMGNLKEFIDLP